MSSSFPQPKINQSDSRRLVNSTFEAISGMNSNPFRHPPSISEAMLHSVLSPGSHSNAYSRRDLRHQPPSSLQVLCPSHLRQALPLLLFHRIPQQSSHFDFYLLFLPLVPQFPKKWLFFFSTFAFPASFLSTVSWKSGNVLCLLALIVTFP